MNTIAIQVFAFDEPADRLRDTLEAIISLPTPDNSNVRYETWITPAGDDDTSMTVAESTGFNAFEAPSGKLSSRNVAHDHALNTGADIIATWDADAPPLSHQTLIRLAEPFEKTNVVAVNSSPVSRSTPAKSNSLFGAVIDIGALAEDIAVPHMHGQCSAFQADAWGEIGPFSESIDQTDSNQVRSEEEIQFYSELAQKGDVVYAPAHVYNDPRRHLCRIPMVGDAEYCQARGVETFTDQDYR
jgi:hypothetical protein